MSESAANAVERETGRVEAFSDGVFSIAITLLALELKVPHAGDDVSLGRALFEQWPTYVAYVTSFITIGIMWMNHHRLFTLIRRVDSGLMVFNLMLLFGIVTVVFPTSLISQYIGHAGEREAAVIYAATYLFIAICFNLLWRYTASPHRSPRLLAVPDDHPMVREVSKRYLFGPITYGIALVVGFASARLSFAIMCALALYWALQLRWSAARQHRVRD